MEIKGGGDVYIQSLEKDFFPPLLPTDKRKCTVLMGENLINMPPVCGVYCTKNGQTKMLAHSWLHHSDKTSGQNTRSFKNRLRNHVMDNNVFSIKKYLQDKEQCLRKINIFHTNLKTPQHTHDRRLVAGVDLLPLKYSVQHIITSSDQQQHKQERTNNLTANPLSDSCKKKKKQKQTSVIGIILCFNRMLDRQRVALCC